MNTPTKITVTRIAAIVLMIIALFVLSFFGNLNLPELGNTGINLIFLIIFVFFLVASFTDFLDGYLARKNNQVTDLGKFLDPVADKLLINSMVIFLVAPSIFAPYTTNQLDFNVWCAIILIARDIVVDALRFIAAKKNVVIAANIFGKMKTVLEMVAISLVLLNGFPFRYFDQGWVTRIAVYLCTAVSLLSGIIYVVQNRNVFKEDKTKSVTEALKEELSKNNQLIGSVESFTGGQFAKLITSYSGASKYYKGTLVTYASELKASLLNIDQKIIDKYGVVSKEVSELMAKEGKRVMGVDYCVSFTGNAGPDAMEGKPVGEVYISLASEQGVKTLSLNLKGNREEIQKEGVLLGLNLLKEEVLEKR